MSSPIGGAPDRVLALDTTAARCSVALAGAYRMLPMMHGHSRHVVSMVRQVLAEAGLAPAAIDAVAFGSGPGAFTGLRIACGVAQGLAYGWDRPVVAVDAMRTLAWQAFAATDAPVACVALDVRMGEVCRAVFARTRMDGAGWLEAHLPATLVAPDRAAADFEAIDIGEAVLAGDAFDLHPALAAWADGRPRPADALQPDARAVAELAAIALHAGRATRATEAAPLYLRDKVALDVDEQAQLRARHARAESR